MRRAARQGAQAAYVERVLRSSGDAGPGLAPVEHDEPDGSGPLTAREHQVLQLVAIGYSNQEIAAELQITVWTVKRHISNVFEKLAVSSRTEAVFSARQRGLLPR